MELDKNANIKNDIIEYFQRMSKEQYVRPNRKPAYNDTNKIYFNRVNTKDFLIGDLFGYDYSFLTLYTYYKFFFLSYVLKNNASPDIMVNNFYERFLNKEFSSKLKEDLIYCIKNVDGYERQTGEETVDYIEKQQYMSLGFSKQVWKNILKNWIKLSNDEKIAYKLRSVQHGKKRACEFWYNDLPPFLEWAELIDQLENADFIEMTTIIDDQELLNSKYLSDQFIEKLISTYSAYRNNKQILSKSSIVSIFLQCLVSNYNFDICDYLAVVDNRIEIRHFETRYSLNSNKNVFDCDNGLFTSLEESETYKRTEGISGSVLVGFDKNLNASFHVGTNNLAKDCRQSPYHNSKYLEVYGKDILNDENYLFDNFWVFPLIDENEKIFAVFRVINKRDDKGNYQPLAKNDRAILLNIAKWFQIVMRFVETISNYSIEAVSKEDIVWNYFDASTSTPSSKKIIADFCQEIATMKCLNNDQYQSRRLFNSILEHLIITANRKIENRCINCSLYFINNEDNWNPCNLERLDNCGKYESLEFEDISHLYYDKYSPHNAIFAFTNSSSPKLGYSFKGILRLCLAYNDKIHRSFSAINTLTKKHPNIICFFLDGTNKNIKIFFNGCEQAQCYLSQSCGKWKFRLLEQEKRLLVNKIKNNLHLDNINIAEYKKLIDIIFPVILKRANSNQGTLIVYDYEDQFKQAEKGIWSTGYNINIEIEDCYYEELSGYLSLDGATIIGHNKIAQKAGVILKAKHELPLETTSLLKRSGKGSRHTIAACIAHSYPKSIVFVVSDNGGISIFMGDERLMFDW